MNKDIDGYNPEVTELLVQFIQEPVQSIQCPYEDIQDIMDWLDEN